MCSFFPLSHVVGFNPFVYGSREGMHKARVPPTPGYVWSLQWNRGGTREETSDMPLLSREG